MSEMIKKQIQDLNDVLECCGVLEVTQDHFEFLRLRDRLSNEPVPEEFRAEIEAVAP
jgi:transcription termination factor Rho